jgi:hypothetical protein
MQPPSAILSRISVITRGVSCAFCEGSALWNVRLHNSRHTASAEALLRITATDWHPVSSTTYCVRQWKYAYHP